MIARDDGKGKGEKTVSRVSVIVGCLQGKN